MENENNMGSYECSNPDCECTSDDKQDFNEEGLCRNCEVGKEDAMLGNL